MPGADFRRGIFRASCIDIDQHHTGTFLTQAVCNSAADSRSSSGYDRHSPFEFQCHSLRGDRPSRRPCARRARATRCTPLRAGARQRERCRRADPGASPGSTISPGGAGDSGPLRPLAVGGGGRRARRGGPTRRCFGGPGSATGSSLRRPGPATLRNVEAAAAAWREGRAAGRRGPSGGKRLREVRALDLIEDYRTQHTPKRARIRRRPNGLSGAGAEGWSWRAAPCDPSRGARPRPPTTSK